MSTLLNDGYVEKIDSDSRFYNSAMALNDANLACSQIHNLVQSSGLHFVINQTPWSSYITLRKKFIKPSALSKVSDDVGSEELTALRRMNKYLEEKLTNAQIQLVTVEDEYKSEKVKWEEIIENMHTKVETLEKKIGKKNEIISSVNAGFNDKTAELKTKVEELENLKKVTMKKEIKAKKKLKQKVENNIVVDANLNDEPHVHAIDVEKKDDNENVLVESSLKANTTVSPIFNSSSALASMDMLPPTSQKCAFIGSSQGTPLSPHTPPGLPPSHLCNSESQHEAPVGALSCYFEEPSHDLLEDSENTTKNLRPIISAEYMKNISRINLAPR